MGQPPFKEAPAAKAVSKTMRNRSAEALRHPRTGLRCTACSDSASYNSRMRNAGRRETIRADMVTLRNFIIAGVFLVLGCVGSWAAKEFVMPSAQPARTYPAHDDHPLEKVTV